MDQSEQRDRPINPYVKMLETVIAEDDYSEESDPDSVWLDGYERMQNENSSG